MKLRIAAAKAARKRLRWKEGETLACFILFISVPTLSRRRRHRERKTGPHRCGPVFSTLAAEGCLVADRTAREDPTGMRPHPTPADIAARPAVIAGIGGSIE